MACVPTPDTDHPAIARIRSYFDAFQRGDSPGYARQWTYPAGLFADGRWSTVPDEATMARNNDAYARAQREAGHPERDEHPQRMNVREHEGDPIVTGEIAQAGYSTL